MSRLLRASRPFGDAFQITLYTNFTKEPVPQEALDSCRFLLYQNIGEKWGEVSSENLLARLPSAAESLQVPNCFFKGYWPFWINTAPIDFGDSVVERLVGMGLSAEEIKHVYLHTDITNKSDLAIDFEESMRIEEAKEATAVVQTVPFVREHWRTTKVFSTVNHPEPVLLLHVANGILTALGFAPLQKADLGPLDYYRCDPDDALLELPIHPQVAAFHNVSFADAATKYHIFDKAITFEQYLACFVDCRLRNLNLLEYLEAVRLE